MVDWVVEVARENLFWRFALEAMDDAVHFATSSQFMARHWSLSGAWHVTSI